MNSLTKSKLMIVSALTLVCAVSYSSTILAGEQKLELERINSRDASISHVYLSPTQGDFKITGYLRKSMNQRGHIPGHMHMEIFGNNGELLIKTTNDYHRHNRKSRWSHFSEVLPVNPNQVGKVRIIHHGLDDGRS